MESEKEIEIQVNKISSSTSEKNDTISKVGGSDSKSRRIINWLKIYNLDPVQVPIISSTSSGASD